MVENQDLLRSVLRDPEQDQPRERYADWCAEQDEPATRARADFIRTQIALAKTSEFSNPEPYLELRARERRLLASYRDAWAEPVRDRVRSYDFNRGFIELISVSARKFLERGEELGDTLAYRIRRNATSGPWFALGEPRLPATTRRTRAGDRVALLNGTQQRSQLQENLQPRPRALIVTAHALKRAVQLLVARHDWRRTAQPHQLVLVSV